MKKSLEEIYEIVEHHIKCLDFNKFWPGFYPLRFALYNENECFFDKKYIPKSSDFLANTAIEFDNEMIAIWNVLEEMNPKVLTSKMIHEMFHGYQKINNELRFPDETNAIYNYEYSDENLSIKLYENKLLTELVREFDIEKYNLLLRLKKYRYNKFNYEFIYEAKIEQVEGAANYVELCVLKELDYTLYLAKVNEMIESLKEPKNLLPIRIISYDSGALFLHLLKENNIKFNMEFSEKTFVEELILNVDAIDKFDNLCMDFYIKDYFQKSKKVIENALKTNEVVLDKSVALLGFNVYNAIYTMDYIISTYFVMYEDCKPIILYGDYVIETPSEGIITKIYKIQK